MSRSLAVTIARTLILCSCHKDAPLPKLPDIFSGIYVRVGSEPDVAGVRELGAQALAPYEGPKRVCSRTEPLPRTPSGKLLRREL